MVPTNPGVLMARRAAMLLTEIWRERSWRSLDRDAQWLYMFLLSQPDLSHCGVISLRPGRWAQAAADTDTDHVMAAAKHLESAGYVVIDEDTGELLVRALIRRDRIFMQPNLMRSAVAALPTVESPVILRALRIEVERIIRENQDPVRLARGELTLSDQQKQPLTRMAQSLSALGAPAHDLSSPNGTGVNPSANPSEEGLDGTPDGRATAETSMDVPAHLVTWENTGGVNPSGNPSLPDELVNSARLVPAQPVSSPNEGGVNPSANPLGDRGKGLGSGSEVVTLTTKDQPLKEFPQTEVDQEPLPGLGDPPERARPPAGGFDLFWTAYPHKRDKDAARRAWDKITRGKDRVPTPLLIEAAKHYAQSAEVASGYAKYPATFLNKGSWRDFVQGQPEGRPRSGNNAQRALDIAAQRRARRATGGEITDGRR